MATKVIRIKNELYCELLKINKDINTAICILLQRVTDCNTPVTDCNNSCNTPVTTCNNPVTLPVTPQKDTLTLAVASQMVHTKRELQSLKHTQTEQEERINNIELCLRNNRLL